MTKRSRTKIKYYFSVLGLIVVIILAVVTVLNSSMLQSVISPTAPKSKPSAGAKEPITTNAFRDNFSDGSLDTSNWTIVTRGNVSVGEYKTGRLSIEVTDGLADGMDKMGALRFNTVIPENNDFVLKAEVRRVTVAKDALGRGGIRFVASAKESKQWAILRRLSRPGKDGLEFIVARPDGGLATSEIVELKATDKVTLKLERVGNKYRAWYKPGIDNSDIAWIKVGAEQDDLFNGPGYLELYAANYQEDGASVVAKFDDALIKW